MKYKNIIFSPENRSRSKYSLRYIVFSLAVLLLLLCWHGLERYNNYKSQQFMLVQNSVKGAAAELDSLLNHLKYSVSVFSKEHLSLVQFLAENPENTAKYEYLKEHAKIHFPNYFAVTIANDKGVPLIGNFDLMVNEICQHSIKEFIAGGYNYDIFIHPHVDAYHFDIMTPWTYSNNKNKKGIFFISIKPKLFTRVLKNAELLDHKLVLINKDSHGLIEVSSEGTRLQSKEHDGNFRITSDKIKQISFSMPVAGTRWNLVDIPQKNSIALMRNTILLQTFFIFLSFTLISLFFLKLIRREEQLHNSSNKKLESTKDKLERALEFSHVATWEYDISNKLFNWSYHAKNIFQLEPPVTCEQYIESLHPDFKNDFLSFINNCLKLNTNQHFEHKIYINKYDTIWIEISGSHEDPNSENQDKLLGLIQDITDRKIAEQNHINFEIQQKDTLLREVHHRIKNNLQGVMSLLEQHKNKEHIDKNILNHAITQLYSVSLIHGINGENADNKIEISSLVNSITKAAFNITGISFKPCYSLDDKHIINTVDNNTVAIALIINELIFNAIKHTPEHLINNIEINIISLLNDAVIEIRNPGQLPENNFDYEKAIGLGTGLTLTRSLLPKPGTEIRFKQTIDGVVCHLILKPPILDIKYESSIESKAKSA